MIGRVGGHRADDADVVDMSGGAGKDLADLNAALPYWNLNGEAAPPVGRSVERLLVGSGLPAYSASSGLDRRCQPTAPLR
jgi:hypothetical protein